MYTSEYNKHMMFWVCGLLTGNYWTTDPPLVHVMVSIVIFAIVCTLIDELVHIAPRKSTRGVHSNE